MQKQPPEVFCKTRSQACNFIKNETLAQVFPCEFCEVSKNTFLHRTTLAAASGHMYFPSKVDRFILNIATKLPKNESSVWSENSEISCWNLREC